MTKKTKTAIYEPPFAKDIAMNFAKGQNNAPMGACRTGTTPFYDCIVGPGILPTCVPTGGTPDVSACAPGGYHTWPACRSGADASTTCGSGHGQQ